MLKIDRLLIYVSLNNKKITSKIINKNFVLEPFKEDIAILKINLGKIENNGVNLGIAPNELKAYLEEVYNKTDLYFKKFKTIEYCIDIETNFKLIDNKFILKSFDIVLLDNGYKSGKLDYTREKGKSINENKWKGIKGYKTSKTLKLYSKIEEKKISTNNDLIRIELTYNDRVITTSKIKNIDDTKKAKEEINKVLTEWEKKFSGKGNQHINKVRTIIKKFQEKLNCVD